MLLVPVQLHSTDAGLNGDIHDGQTALLISFCQLIDD
jgi:hypothetical protein